jgi:hypothetical protein
LNSTIINEAFNEFKNVFHLPSSFSYLKHLNGKYDILSPSFIRQTRNINLFRINITFIIGIRDVGGSTRFDSTRPTRQPDP